MARLGYRPVMEYCGGTEIGGGFLAGSLLQPQSPAAFSTPALGAPATPSCCALLLLLLLIIHLVIYLLLSPCPLRCC